MPGLLFDSGWRDLGLSNSSLRGDTPEVSSFFPPDQHLCVQLFPAPVCRSVQVFTGLWLPVHPYRTVQTALDNLHCELDKLPRPKGRGFPLQGFLVRNRAARCSWLRSHRGHALRHSYTSSYAHSDPHALSGRRSRHMRCRSGYSNSRSLARTSRHA